MKTLIGPILALLACSAAVASPTLVTNPYLPYPPGCARMPDPYAPGGLEKRAVKFYEKEVRFYTSQAGEPVPMTLRGFRAPCSEPNRSLIWLEFLLPARYTDEELDFLLPTPVAEVAPHTRRLVGLAIEPNGWGTDSWVDSNAMYLTSRLQGLRWYYGLPGGERRWVFLLDNGPPVPQFVVPNGLTPTEYNEAFTLVLRYDVYDFLSISVPATRDVVFPAVPRVPLSGRLSGTWVISGTADQGLLLFIAEEVQPDLPDVSDGADMPMIIFLAHYTFDEAGNMLWLTGNAEFQPGQVKVTIPIVQAIGGEFRGSKRAEREIIGQVTLRSFSCNDLRFEYDYSGIGLGHGTRRLERLFSLEIAGHDCRDNDAKSANDQ